MFVPNKRKYENRFSLINPGKMGRSFWQAHKSDVDPDPAEKFTLEEARTKLKEQGYAVMKQTALDSLIDEKHGEGYKKGKKDGDPDGLKEKVESLTKDNTKLKEQVGELKKDKPDMISKAEHEQLVKVEQEKYSKLEERNKTLLESQKDNALLKAFGSKAVDSDSVLQLTRGKFAMDDDGNVYPIDDKGGKLIDGEGIVTLDRFYDNFFKEKPYLAKAADSNGAGSSTGGGGNPTTGGKYTDEQLANMSMDDYVKAGGMDALAQ